jgi:TonB family protein
MQNIKVVCGPPMLGDAAIAAISQWRYEPYRVEGVATPVSGSFYVNFTIGSEGLKHTGCEIPKLPPTLTPPPSRPPALPPAPEGILRISGRVMANSLDKKVDPVYPADSITVDARGTVLSLATIDKTGAVTDVQVISGPARFHEATVAAIKQWRYRPYEIDGKPVDVETTISLDFAPPR